MIVKLVIHFIDCILPGSQCLRSRCQFSLDKTQGRYHEGERIIHLDSYVDFGGNDQQTCFALECFP